MPKPNSKISQDAILYVMSDHWRWRILGTQKRDMRNDGQDCIAERPDHGYDDQHGMSAAKIGMKSHLQRKYENNSTVNRDRCIIIGPARPRMAI